ncbi:PREDICTED: protein phosphatase 2C-like domain-containing protein 1 [Elephantulus edwardii]|uniref:protein phosphatase 2C-like domain-containing protein 1 n=1 Tax=Elephantulus edwardii TaxID=28737 RepID=UPI0003F0BBDC|nr:PREDICTED: protein phosphatase 2C-like domain-containing protein 1 [Elephantulus edwardii]
MQISTALRVFWKSTTWRTTRLKTDTNREATISSQRKDAKNQKVKLSIDDHGQRTSGDAITLPCSICKQEIDLPSIFFHKKQHEGLATLRFHWMGKKKPPRAEILAQRQFLINKLLSSFVLSEKALQTINNNFELVWREHIPAYYKIVDNLESSSVYSPEISHVLIKGMAICEDRNASWRSSMGNTFTTVDNFGKKHNVLFFGVFDGHRGTSAAEFARVELPVLLLHQMSTLDPSYQMSPEEQQVIDSFSTVFTEEYVKIEDQFSSTPKRTEIFDGELEGIHKAFAKAFWRMDRLLRLGRKEASNVLWSGCSVLTCLLEGTVRKQSPELYVTESTSFRQMPEITSGILHVANAGNVQAVLCRNGTGFCLTKEHTMKNIMERRRILDDGAKIASNEPNELLEGRTKTTRGLGFHGNAKLKKFMIPAPETISVPIDDLCQFLVVATDGLWDVLDKKEVVMVVMTMFRAYKAGFCSGTHNQHSPSKLSEATTMQSEGSIYTLYQYEPSEEHVATRHSKENTLDNKYLECPTFNLENLETRPPELINLEPHSRRKPNEPACVGDRPTDPKGMENELYNKKDFYEAAAKHISCKLVKAALGAGSRSNITVMVILLSGSAYQLLI